MPKFSIIIPVYNVERYLQECLDSVVGQTFADWEAICINDGSTDGSGLILENYATADSRIKVYTQQNGGLSAARNSGLAHAQGEYILFLDSDDYLHTDALRILDDSIEDQDLICFNGIRFHDEDRSTETADCMPETSYPSGWDYYNRHALDPRHFAFVCVVLRCYRSAYLNAHKLKFCPGIYHEDNLFTPLACYHAQTVSVIKDALYYYRLRAGSIMKTASAKHNRDILFVANSLAAFFTRQRGIDTTTVYRAITHHYQVVFAQADKSLHKELHRQVDWKLYRKVSRTKLRHRVNYLIIRIFPKSYTKVTNK